MEYNPSAHSMFVLSLLLCLVWISPFSSSQDSSKKIPDHPHKMKLTTDEREQTIDQLLAIVTDEKLQENNREKVIKAIQALGSLKAIQAAPELVELIDYQRDREDVIRTKGHRGIPSPRKVYPAMDALMKMGKPVLPIVIHALLKKERDNTFKRNVRVLNFRILDEKRENVNEFIRRQIKIHKHEDLLKEFILDDR